MPTDYRPSIIDITNISKAFYAVITTDGDHDYNIGNSVIFNIPSNFGMVEMNGKVGFITSVTSNTFTVNINTKSFTTFSVPGSYYTPAHVAPVGDRNWGFTIPGTVPTPVGVSGAFRVVQT